MTESTIGMAEPPTLVGLLDSGIATSQFAWFASGRNFSTHQGDCYHSAPIDRLGHGSALAQVLIDTQQPLRFKVAQIFDRQLTTSAVRAAEGLDWLVGAGVRLVNLSFGLRHDRPELAQACQRAVDAGVVLVASSPAVGEPVFPAAYPGVIRVTGDARCQPGELSWAPSKQADYGACVRSPHPKVVGASVAAAHLSGQVLTYLRQFPDQPLQSPHLHSWLKQRAQYQQAQRPFALIPWQRRLTWQEGVL